jgi:hypothetical protein
LCKALQELPLATTSKRNAPDLQVQNVRKSNWNRKELNGNEQNALLRTKIVCD